MEEMFEKFGFVWNQRRCSWTRWDFKITIYSEEENICLIVSGLKLSDKEESIFMDDNYCLSRIPKNDDELKAIFKLLTGNELTESGFKLSI